jgi:hypothetical protein
MKTPRSARTSRATPPQQLTPFLACAIFVFGPESMHSLFDGAVSYAKVLWTKLVDEPLMPGDLWASHDPNTPERQGEGSFNLKMQAIHPKDYGVPVTEIHPGEGNYWRPQVVIRAQMVAPLKGTKKRTSRGKKH